MEILESKGGIMLLQIRDFMAREKMASDQQIAREFSIDIEALKPMMDVWLRKRVFIACEEPSGCKSRCANCKTPPVYYRYC